jgi:hypothetical protein
MAPPRVVVGEPGSLPIPICVPGYQPSIRLCRAKSANLGRSVFAGLPRATSPPSGRHVAAVKHGAEVDR